MVTDTNLVDHYARHLADVNQNNAVIAKESIFNADGVLLLKAGSVFHQDVVEKILNFELVKPLDESVCIETPLTGNLGTVGWFFGENSNVDNNYQLRRSNIIWRMRSPPP